MKTTAIAPWYGSARMNAEKIAARINAFNPKWVGIPFCGGCSEVPWIKCGQILAGDVHRHVINLCQVLASPGYGQILRDRVEGLLFHPDTLSEARRFIEHVEYMLSKENAADYIAAKKIEWAAAYFTNCWMSRSDAGSSREFDNGMSIRFTATGGGSLTRWQSAIESIDEWNKTLRERVQFCVMDYMEFFVKVQDREGHVVYLDPPWLKGGERYENRMTEEDHANMLIWAAGWKNVKVVIRHCDHPLYRRMLPETNWTWEKIGGRSVANSEVDEWLIYSKA